MNNLQLTQPPVAKAEMLIRKPVTEVFAAFVDPAITTQFWFTKSSGRLEPGKQIQWEWEMYGAAAQVAVKASEYKTFDQAPPGSAEAHGLSVFVRDGDSVFHTYSTYARGCELIVGTYNYLDFTPFGRQEDWEEPAGRSDGPPMSWLRRHDQYALNPITLS